ncbi:MAG: hypothetical protein O7A64_10535, partial [Alphaproteobacteria bacterium]|nr:hypothetical protein [Alphaproteobacteria bacterium]
MVRRLFTVTVGGLIVAAGLLLAFPAGALAKSEINASFIASVAIEGTDPVAYFAEGKAVKGSSDYTHR